MTTIENAIRDAGYKTESCEQGIVFHRNGSRAFMLRDAGNGLHDLADLGYYVIDGERVSDGGVQPAMLCRGVSLEDALGRAGSMPSFEILSENTELVNAIRNAGYELEADSWHIEFHRNREKAFCLFRGSCRGLYNLAELGYCVIDGRISVYGNPRTVCRDVSIWTAIGEASRLSE